VFIILLFTPTHSGLIKDVGLRDERKSCIVNPSRENSAER